MGSAIGNTIAPVSLKCAAEAIYDGYLYKDNGSGQMTAAASVNDTIVAVAAQSSLDVQDGSAKTLAAGDEHPFFLLGSGAKVMIASKTGITYQTWAGVYNGQTADTNGRCDSSSANSATLVGHYIGKDAFATAAAGELIAVLLDVESIAT